MAQLISVATVVVWALSTGLALFWAIKRFVGLRATRDEEMEGLDGPEHGVPAYPEFPVAREALTMGDSGDGDYALLTFGNAASQCNLVHVT